MLFVDAKLVVFFAVMKKVVTRHGCIEQGDRFRDRQRQALDHDDNLALEELQVFRKDVGTFLRQYDFLSQIVDYEDHSLEKLSIYLRHLAPVIAESQLNHEIDLSTVDFDYIAQHQQGTTSGKQGGGIPLQPVKESGTGTAHDREMVALDAVIAQLNDLFSGDHPDLSVRNVVTHIKDRLEESETLQQQAQNNSLNRRPSGTLMGELEASASRRGPAPSP